MGNIRVWLYAFFLTLVVGVGHVCLAQTCAVGLDCSPTITTSALPDGMETSTYEGAGFQCTETHGGGASNKPTWTATGLPSGLSISSGGLISGTIAAGEGNQSYNVTLRATNFWGNDQVVVTLVVHGVVEFTSSGNIGTAMVGAAYSYTVPTSGGYTDTVGLTFSEGTQTLPGWLTLDTSTGELSGSPDANDAANSPFTFDIDVVDEWNPATSDSETFTVDVEAGQISITTGSLPIAEVGVPYSVDLTSIGGIGTTRTWTVTGLPASLNASTSGTISGTPLAGDEDTYVVNIEVLDEVGDGDNTILSLVVAAAGSNSLTITTTFLDVGTEGVAYSLSAPLAASGGVSSNYGWVAVGLPSGLFLNGDEIQGTPVYGSASLGGDPYSVELTVTDGQNLYSAFFELTIVEGSGSESSSSSTNFPNIDLVGSASSCSLSSAAPTGTWFGLIALAGGLVYLRRRKLLGL